ncbi:LysR family transcriptional regulator [Streptomyces sp. WELS2]|uniref:LysR family transcriptional regulator n=1 Tax=Streptomyces sp. WELS2 TaxID=2749435 RepID=UPI0037DBFA45
MELRHLRYFVVVAEELHFGRAAQRLHVAQPGLSRQIRALERVLAVELFTHNRRGVTPADAGTALLPAAKDILARARRHGTGPPSRHRGGRTPDPQSHPVRAARRRHRTRGLVPRRQPGREGMGDQRVHRT